MRYLLLLSALIAVLAMAPVAPEAGNILFLFTGAASLLLLRKPDLAAVKRPIIWMPLSGLAILSVAFMLGDGSVSGLEGILAFAPIMAIWPLMSLTRQSQSPEPRLLAVLSFVGVAGAVAVALNEYLLTGTTRAGATVANPIHFADVALMAGFLSLIGVVYIKTPSRYLFLLATVLAATAVTLSGTRGAVVAFVLMSVTAIALAGAMRMIRLRTLGIIAVGALVILTVGFAAGLGQSSGVERVLADVADVLHSGLPTDESTAIRLSMYQGGLAAFFASPIFGHGPFGFVAAAAATQQAPLFVGAPHLHNDIADFAASAGVFGLLAYGLFMLAPVVEMLRAPPSTTKSGVVIIVSALVTGHFVMGLTNAMFGILTVTTYFAAICLIVGLLTERRVSEPESTDLNGTNDTA